VSWAPGPRWRIVDTNRYDKKPLISGFDREDDNALHVEMRGFTPEEVEEALTGDHKIGRARPVR
jgi:hypothetical protein